MVVVRVTVDGGETVGALVPPRVRGGGTLCFGVEDLTVKCYSGICDMIERKGEEKDTEC